MTPIYVPPTGTRRLPLIIVGEAPGQQEARLKKPFVGPAGSVLRQLAKRANFDIDDGYVTNVEKHYFGITQAPTWERVQKLRPELLDEIRQVAETFETTPVVLTLGNTATRAVFGKKDIKITQVRGVPATCEELPGLWIVPTIHPAAVLRGTQKPGDILQDMLKALKIALKGRPQTPKVQWVVINSIQRMQEVVDEVLTHGSEFVAVDIETDGFRWTEDKILQVGFYAGGDFAYIVPERLLSNPAIRNQFHRLAQAKKWVGHNFKFDMHFLRQAKIPARLDADTLLMHYTMDERRGTHGLKQLVAQFLSAPDYEADIKQYLSKPATDSYRLIPPGVLAKYLAHDVVYTWHLHKLFSQWLEKQPTLQRLHNKLLLPASRFLGTVERSGLLVNVSYLETLESKLEFKAREEIKRFRSKAEKLGWSGELYASSTGVGKIPEKLNPSSPKQLKWFLYDRLRLQPPRGYEKNTRKDTLAKLLEHSKDPKVVDLLESLLAYRKTKKLLSTYVVGLRRDIHNDGRVHPTYQLHGTVTGRLSSRGPNIQNIPREKTIRNLFVPSEGNVFVEADYAQAELRVLAYLSGDARLQEIFREGRDLHTEATIALVGPSFTKEDRVRIKMVNFGVVYGRGAASIAAQFDMPLSEAQKLVDGWAKHYVQAWEYLEEQAARALRGEELETIFGRRRRFMVAPDKRHMIQNEARNFAIQSTASDLTLISAMAIAKQLPQGAKIVNLVHDSILVETPPEYADELYKKLPQTMQETAERLLKIDFPFLADAKIGTAWGDMHEVDA